MFNNLFFILLVLALINFVPDLETSMWTFPPGQAFQWGMVCYLGFLGLFFLQIKGLARYRYSLANTHFFLIINCELLIFLSIYHLALGSQRFLAAGHLSSYHVLFSFFSLLLYLGGLGWAHFWYHVFYFHHSFKHSLKQASNQVLFLCPFCLPYIFFSFLFDLLDQLPLWQRFLQEADPLYQSLALIGITVVLLICAMGFIPPLLMWFCRCKPIENKELANRLEKICLNLRFKHAGIRMWTIMRHTFTAGIVGIFPFARYIMFTPPLLSRFKPEEIEAILVHEIGHNRYKHLLIYPFILMGMIISGTALIVFLNEYLFAYFKRPSFFALETRQILFTISLFSCYALMLGFYFRYIFGFFSRLFERQADLYIFEHALSPHYMIQALDRIGVVTGYTHHHPSWHHFSIDERIQFLETAIEKPELVQKHHRRVKRWLSFYFLALGIGSWALFYFT